MSKDILSISYSLFIGLVVLGVSLDIIWNLCEAYRHRFCSIRIRTAFLPDLIQGRIMFPGVADYVYA